MSSEVSPLDHLNTFVWNFKTIQAILQHDPTWVKRGLLHFVLKSKNCSADIVDLILRNGADANAKDKFNRTCLRVAICHARNVEVVKALAKWGPFRLAYGSRELAWDLEQGTRQTIVCVGYASGCSKDVIECMLDFGGYTMRTCMLDDHYCSPLHCAAQPKVSTDVLQMLMDRGASINDVNKGGQSVMCYALQNKPEAHIIRWLLDAGGSCPNHASLLVCATNSWDTHLKASVVELLLKAGACPNEVNEDSHLPLQSALLKCVCETEAIALLLDCHKDLDLNSIVDLWGDTLLHLAVKNYHCMPSVVELLIDRGVAVGIQNMDKRTAIGEAIRTKYYSSLREEKEVVCGTRRAVRIIISLITPAQASTEELSLAVTSKCNVEIVKWLWWGCGLISKSLYNSLLKIVSDQLLESDNQAECFKFLLKSYFLDFSDYRMQFLDAYHEYFNPNLNYIKRHYFIFGFRCQCVRELQRMKSIKLGRRHTLYDLLKPGPEVNIRYDLDDLLGVAETFPVYFDLIAQEVDRPLREDKLQGLQVYLGNRLLNYDIVVAISEYLILEEDLLSFVLAFRRVDGQGSRAQGSRGRKRKAEAPALGS